MQKEKEMRKGLRMSGLVGLVCLLTACGSPSGPTAPPAAGVTSSAACRWDPQNCMYEGSYEPGEKEFAEQRAKDLNRAAARKLRRASWW